MPAPQHPGAAPVPLRPPAPTPYDRPLPINLPTALQLAGVRPLDIAAASERIRAAAAQLQAARVLWLPTIYLGTDYARHDGQIQRIEGDVFTTSRSSFMVGGGPSAVFALSEAIFAPLAARQVIRAREADWQAAANNSLLAVAEAYFNVQQARGELAGALDTARRAEELVRRAEQLAPGLAPPVEVVRARTELARRRQQVESARERWRTASAELGRVLRLDYGVLVEPLEPPHLQVTLLAPHQSVDDLIAIGLVNRPELAAQQALVQATLLRLRQEKLRPLVPSVLLRGNATNPAGTLAAGLFGGGINDNLSNFNGRSDFDIQVLWELQNLGIGNRARVEERRAEQRLALIELFRIQDRVAADVAQAHAQLAAAAARLGEAESGLRDAVDSMNKNFEGLGQTRRAGELLLLVIRPQEAVAALGQLAQAYNDYYGAVGDYNRAQFRLYRALGQPAQFVTHSNVADAPPDCPTAPGSAETAAPEPAPVSIGRLILLKR
ncbi:MAG TPA: TolC family protein [Gemmataceae bacterium]|nr:TolC family protein [Gemmataceae bacterium]